MPKETSLLSLKKKLGIPLNSKFIGWLIHLPHSDEYLMTFQIDDFSSSKSWIKTPEKSKKFKTQKKADQIIRMLEIEDRSESVPAFDMGTKIAVGTSLSIGIENVSPFRADT
jgi:hypothetical protein